MKQSHFWNVLVSQVVKKFPALYGTRKFITMFTRVRHWSLSWVKCVRSTPSNPISLRSSLILSFHVRLGLPSSLFHSGLPTTILCIFLICPMLGSALLGKTNRVWRCGLGLSG